MGERRPRRQRGQCGTVTLSLTLLASLVFGTVVALHAAGLVVTHRGAQNAADLAALAGAGALVRGETACAAAASIADRNGATLTECAASAEAVTVTVARRYRVLGRDVTLAARARAGASDPTR